MTNVNRISRRQFITRTAGTALGAISFPYIVPSSVLGQAGSVAPSNRITMGCIGVGWQGGSNMNSFLREKDCQIAAICDVGKNHLQGAVNRVNDQNKNCAFYADYRELLGRKIHFNPQTEEILDDKTATSLLGKSVCSPWHL